MIARRMWRTIPAPLRYWIYRTSLRTIEFIQRVTLWHHWVNAGVLWPDARGIDRLALTVWGPLLRFHSAALGLAWSQAARVRRRRGANTDVIAGKVLHVTGSFDVGGSQTQIRNLCTQPSTRFQHEAIEIFPEMNYLYRRGVRIDADRYMGRGVLGRTAGRLVINTGYRSPQLLQAYKLARDFRAERPAIVVGWGHEMCATTFVAATLARVPHIVFCIRTVNPTYGWIPPSLGAMLLAAHRAMLPLVSQVAVNSTLLQADHAAWVGMDPARIAVCANGIEVVATAAEARAQARRRVRAELGIADDTIVIVNIGRFSGEKGQMSLIEANRILREQPELPPFVIVLYGDGATLEDVRGRAAALGMTNVMFPGRTDAVRDALSASDIFVMPSDFEGMPNAMMEAMAAGLPCLSTTRSGARDVARDGVEALYYEPRDASALAAQLARLLTDPPRAVALGAAARRRVQEFSVARSVACFEAVLDQVTAAGRAAG